jgi:uncharacterized protein (TIGR02284 family)
MADNSDVTSVLNGLIETAKDGENGFRHAGEKAKDPSLKSIFSRYAAQRASYASELQSVVAGLGDKPAESGHVAGSLHRGWISLKETLSKNDDKALVDEAEAGEDAAVKAYREAASKSLPAEALSVVQRQFAGVQEAHAVIRDLKHNWTGSAAATV